MLLGCGGGGGGGATGATAQSPNAAATTYGHFRKTQAAGGSSVTATAKVQPMTANTTVDMSYPREGQTSTLLADGRVLIAGGNPTTINNPNLVPYDSAELFDPNTEAFSLVPSRMSYGRTEHCAVLMPDKRVLLIGGGYNYGPVPDLSTVDIFDPVANSFSAQQIVGWETLGNGTTGNEKLHCFPLSGGRVFIYGGVTTQSVMAAPAVLDLTTWTVRPVTLEGTDPLFFERNYAASVQASDGRVFVVGGQDAHSYNTGLSQDSADILVFDPVTETMAGIGEMQTVRSEAGILAMDDGSIEVYGGAYSTAPTVVQRLTSVERISSAGVSTKIGDLATTKNYFTSVMLQNDRSLHVGGSGSDGTSTATELVFDENSHWSAYTGNMIEERSDFGIAMLGTGRVLITGGYGMEMNNGIGTDGVSSTGEIYEPDAQLYITMTNPVLALGESAQLTPSPNVSVTWSARLGTVSASGLYTAPDAATWQAKGTAPFDEVTATGNGRSATVRIPLIAQ